jgi:hypothetical protein
MRHSILALLLFFTLQVAAQAPAVHEARPRMLADAERIAWMQAHHQQPGPFGDAFATVLNAYTNNWITDPDLYMACWWATPTPSSRCVAGSPPSARSSTVSRTPPPRSTVSRRA